MRASAAAVAVVAGVVAVSGCASSGAKKPATLAVSPAPVGPSGASGGTRPVVLPIRPKRMRGLAPAEEARFLTPTRLAIPAIAGSSDCPSVPTKLVVESPHAIRIDLAVGRWGRTPAGDRMQVPGTRGGICLSDLHPVPLVIAVDPKQIDVHRRVKVSLYYPKGVIRRFRRPVVVTVPPFATARIREEVRIARSSNRFFSIFPSVPGTESCTIPHNTPPAHDYRGVCQASVRSRPTMEPSESVTFTESWWPHCPVMAACSPRTLRHHTWQVIEGETVVRPGTKPRVYAIHSRGTTAPQDYK